MLTHTHTRTVGIPREIKQNEYRVSVPPNGVKQLTSCGCPVLVEKNAGLAAGYKDDDYIKVGAKIVDKEMLFNRSDIIVKVKEPQESEYSLLQPEQILFTFFHFAADLNLENAMRKTGAICLAYETLQLNDNSLPILAPMSEIAGRLAIQEGMKLLTSTYNGVGILLSGVAGIEPATVVIIGAGTVGVNAAIIAAGLGAKVYILDTNLSKLRYLSTIMPLNVFTISSSSLNDYLNKADLIIGSVLIPGKRAPKLITDEMFDNMKEGCVFIDVAIDQGGMTEISKPTTHDNPTYKYKGVTMYCVPNIPGIVPQTSSQALANVTLPYIISLAQYGWGRSIERFPELKKSMLV